MRVDRGCFNDSFLATKTGNLVKLSLLQRPLSQDPGRNCNCSERQLEISFFKAYLLAAYRIVFYLCYGSNYRRTGYSTPYNNVFSKALQWDSEQ